MNWLCFFSPLLHRSLSHTHTHTRCWSLVQMGSIFVCLFVCLFCPPPAKKHVGLPQTEHKESSTSQWRLWHYRKWIQSSVFVFCFLSDSYLRREVMCSSDRPPSSSFMMKSLSFSSPGCTGKLLRKISGRKIDLGGGGGVTLNSTWKLSLWQTVFLSCDEITQQVLCLITSSKGPREKRTFAFNQVQDEFSCFTENTSA